MEPKEFHDLITPFLGQEISRPWLGIGTAFYLEVGPFISTYEKSGRPKAVLGLDLGSSWRVEHADQIAWSSDSSRPDLDKHLGELQSRVIESIEMTNGMPELQIQLSGGYRLSTFSMEDQPDWALFLPNQHHLEVKDGVVRVSTDH